MRPAEQPMAHASIADRSGREPWSAASGRSSTEARMAMPAAVRYSRRRNPIATIDCQQEPDPFVPGDVRPQHSDRVAFEEPIDRVRLILRPDPLSELEQRDEQGYRHDELRRLLKCLVTLA